MRRRWFEAGGIRQSTPWLTFDLAPERRSPQPIDRLSRRHDRACTGAVDALQIAAVLEAEGINDRISSVEYGRTDVFSLAGEMHRRVPCRVGEESVPDLDDIPSPRARLLRGPIYLVPALQLTGGRGVFDQPGILPIALVALFLVWIWNHGSAAVLYRRLGNREIAEAHALGRWSLLLGTPVVTLTILPLVPVVDGSGSAVVFAAFQTLYVISAGVLLTLSRDRALVLVLAPGSILAVVALAGVPIPDLLLGLSAAATAVAASGVMFAATRDTSGAVPRWVPNSDLRLASRHAAFGGTWALLIGVGGLAIHPSPGLVGLVGVAAAPMVLTMGVGEWQLLSMRRWARSTLGELSDGRHFAVAAREAFVIALGRYTSALIGATLAVPVVAVWLDLPASRATALSMAFVFLGCGSFAGLALAGLGRASLALWISGVGLGVSIGLIVIARTASIDPVAAFGAGGFAVGVALTVAALREVSQVVVHR